METEYQEQFVEHTVVQALETLLKTESCEEAAAASIVVAKSFNVYKDNFDHIIKNQNGEEEKLISSFYNNMLLLTKKIWVEKLDEELKEQVAYQLTEFTEQMNNKHYSQLYTLFLTIVNTVAYLMFGEQARLKDFEAYSLRIDPEFGIFWWYIKSLPKENTWKEEKNRVVILLGMYFLANY